MHHILLLQIVFILDVICYLGQPITWGPHGVLVLSDDAVNCYDYKASVIDEYGALMWRQWQTKTWAFGEIPARMPVCPPQIPKRGPGTESGGQLTAWGESHRLLLLVTTSNFMTPAAPLFSVDLTYSFLGIVCTLILRLPLRYPGSLYLPIYTVTYWEGASHTSCRVLCEVCTKAEETGEHGQYNTVQCTITTWQHTWWIKPMFDFSKSISCRYWGKREIFYWSLEERMWYSYLMYWGMERYFNYED